MTYTYIVECSDGTLYTGWTTDLMKRVAKYTRSRRPVRLVYSERHETRSEAMKREYEIKQLSRAEKIALIKESNNYNAG